MTTLKLNETILIPKTGRRWSGYSGPSELFVPAYVEETPSESLTLTDTLGIPVWVAGVSDTVGFSELITANLIASISESISFTDTLSTPLFYTLLTESITFSDSISSVISFALSDSGSLTDTLSGKASITEASSESITLSDSISAYLIGSSTESISATDTLSGKLSIVDTLAEAPTVAETLSGKLSIIDSLGSTLSLIESLYGDSVLSGTTTPQAQVIFVVNAETGAVSTYNIPVSIKNIAVFNDAIYLATDGGLYCLSGTNDNGTDIEWNLSSGFSSYGTEYLKRMIDIDVLSSGEGDLIAEMITNRYGEKIGRKYQYVNLSNSSTRDKVIHLAHGISGIYWQFILSGTKQTKISEVKVRAELLSRRR